MRRCTGPGAPLVVCHRHGRQWRVEMGDRAVVVLRQEVGVDVADKVDGHLGSFQQRRDQLSRVGRVVDLHAKLVGPTVSAVEQEA